MRSIVKYFAAVALLLVCAFSLSAQTTTVTGVVTDSNLIPYAGARVTAQLIFAGVPVSFPTVTINVLAQCRANGFGSAPCQVPFSPNQGPFFLDNSGNFPGGGITLQDNTLVTPGATLWLITVNTPGSPPPLGTGPQSCSALLSISGASQNVSANFSACPALGRLGPGASTSVTNIFTAPNIFGDDLTFRGPNPWVDVRRFNVRAVNLNAIPASTCTINIGTPTIANCPGITGFQVNDGVDFPNAGPAHSMTTPVAPTVTPSCIGTVGGIGITIPDSAGGATAYQYQLAMRDTGQGLTAAGTAGTTATGTANLGGNNTAITSIVNLSTNQFQATVGSTSLLVAGCIVVLKGGTDDKEYGGVKIITSIVDGTHFNFSSGVDASRGTLTAASSTGGTCFFWLVNHIVQPTPGAGGTQYEIFGRTAGSMAEIGWSLLANLGYNTVTDPSYNTFDDFGATMMANAGGFPWWAPTTPPVSPTNDSLITTITAINGNNLTLALAASNGIAASAMRFDNAPNIAAAVAASNTFNVNGGGAIRFPSTIETGGGNFLCFVTSSYLVLTGTVTQDGPVCLGDTMERSGGSWNGTYMDSIRLSSPGFSVGPPRITITVRGANPGIWLKGGSINDTNVNVNGNGAVGVFYTSGQAGATFFNDIFSSGGSGDFMTIPFYDYQSPTSFGFGYKMRNISCLTGPTQVDGASLTPCFVSKFNTLINWDYVSLSLRGFAIVAGTSGFSGSFAMEEEQQGGIMPMVSLIQPQGGTVGGAFTIKAPWSDTMAYATVANLSPSTGGNIGASITIQGGNTPSNSGPLVTGNRFIGSLTYIGGAMTQASQLGQNTNYCTLGMSNGSNIGQTITCSEYNINGALVFSNFTPTVTGFGTSPTVTPGTGTASFTITIGAGGTATNGVITLPTAAHGWECHGSDLTTQSATVFTLKQIASTTTSATMANFNTAGAQAAWVAGDNLVLSCMAN